MRKYLKLNALQSSFLRRLLASCLAMFSLNLVFSTFSIGGELVSAMTVSAIVQVPQNGGIQAQLPNLLELLSKNSANLPFGFGPIDGWIYQLMLAAVATLALIATFFLLDFLFSKIRTRIEIFKETQTISLKIQQLQLVSSAHLANGLFILARLMRLALSFLAILIYLTVLPNLFPRTATLGRQVQAHLLNALSNFGRGVIGYLPSLFAIVIVVISVRYILKFLHIFVNALKSGQVHIPGFYQEWIQPTYKLLQALILAIALTLIFPHLPGFGSPAFQGLSLLVGALITLGGASTVSNLIGGFITIYTRAFQIGDRIRIGEFVGYVMEKTILSTRIRTSTNEIITVPNSSLVASTIINYTAALRDLQEPLVLNVIITLGYDIPWREVHKILIAAAEATNHVLTEPVPTVQHKGLNQFDISYELRACTREIADVNEIYSELYQNILDQCNDNGIEILSPNYLALRDGNQITLPEQSLPKGYQPPTFRVDSLDRTDSRGNR